MVPAQAQVINSDFEDRTPFAASGNCVTGVSVARDAPNPWNIRSTPDYSTEFEIGFDLNVFQRTTLSPTFNTSPDGGCFMGFRSLDAVSNEGIYQTISIPDASQELKFTYQYTEYTEPSYPRCTPAVEFRVNSNDDSNGTSISVAPNVGSATGPAAEGQWVSLETSSFKPSDFGIVDGGNMDIYIGVIANSCQRTWGFIDNTEIVLSNLIDAQNDSATGINGFTGDTNIMDVLANNGNGADLLGTPNATTATVSISVDTPATPITGGAPVPSLNTATGIISTPALTPAAAYSITYSICEIASPANCDTANASITIDAAPIDAVDDDFSGAPINGFTGGVTPTVFTNDTLNGSAFAPTLVTPSIVADGGLTGVAINTDGTLNIPAGFVAGNYSVDYQICEVLNSTNCDTATASVTVGTAPIDAVDDDFSGAPINGFTGGVTPTVFTNDTLNGSAFAPTLVTPSIVADGGLTGVTINTDGTLNIPTGFAAGNYPVQYQICEVLNPTNCSIAIANITMSLAPIVANDDAPPAIDSPSGNTTLLNIL
ncbi:MAG: hypothetical protein COC00_007815, partial [Rhizobiales bacterium]|nr:hypothetical protein [Hyphomicrobiales bacterium]